MHFNFNITHNYVAFLQRAHTGCYFWIYIFRVLFIPSIFYWFFTSVLTNPANWRIVSSCMCHTRNSKYINIKPLLKYTDSNLELEMHILVSHSVVCITAMKVQMPSDIRRFFSLSISKDHFHSQTLNMPN